MLENHLEHIDSLDDVTRENFPLSLRSSYVALTTLQPTCDTVHAATALLAAWANANGRVVHTLTVGEVFDAIDDIEEHGAKVLKLSFDQILRMLPTGAKLAMTLGLDNSVTGIAADVIRHSIAHMMDVTPDASLAAHIYELASFAVFEYTIDRQVEGLAKQLGEPEPPPMWLTIAKAAQKELAAISAVTPEPERLAAAIEGCHDVGNLMNERGMLYIRYSKQFDDKFHQEQRGVERQEDTPAPASPFSPTDSKSQKVH